MTEQIFKLDESGFDALALEVFHYQYTSNSIYQQYTDALKIKVNEVSSVRQIPFLPIQFFKTHQVVSGGIYEDMTIFESSGTTGQINSRHFVKDTYIYEQSFRNGFQNFFGDVRQYCILGLLPSYLERGNSSLVYMVNNLIKESGHPDSGFYLNNHQSLHDNIRSLEEAGQSSLFIGVAYALLDFAEEFSFPLHSTKIIETGGMKGRREELLRDEVHQRLQTAFSLETIYSEYGMTELLSQAYSIKDGIFNAQPWMKVLLRDLNDPFHLSTSGKGALNIIDLANIDSCSFIATEDVGEVFSNGSFLVNGRMDNTDIRGCSLMMV